MANEDVVLFSIPSDAGCHFAGQSKAPEAVIKGCKLGGRLSDLGYSVQFGSASDDQAFLEAASWQPSKKTHGIRNEKNVLEVLRSVYNQLRQNANLKDKPGAFQIVIGGDCGLTPAIFAAAKARYGPSVKVGLMYMDGDVDFSLPDESDTATGTTDSMVMTNLTQRKGSSRSIHQFRDDNHDPLIDPSNVVLFGFDPLQPTTEHWVYMLESGFKAFAKPTVQSDPATTAKSALKWLEEQVDVILVHFDVDVIDCAEFPLGNFPHYNGLKFEEAFMALEVFLESEKVKGLTVTEINPNNDVNGTLGMVQRVVDGIVKGMQRRAAGRGK